MAMRNSQARAKLVDCAKAGAGSGAELILVEGDSAMHSVVAVRDDRLQAVLPLQGKPLNAWDAAEAKVAQHVLFRQLAEALGLARPTALSADELARLRYDRVVLLFDPDADGIHIGALMLLYFQRWLPGLLEAGRVWLVRAPMFELVPAAGPGTDGIGSEGLREGIGDAAVRHAYNPAQCRELADAMRLASGDATEPAVRVQAYRGLGGIAPAVLRRLCVDPATRVGHAVGSRDVQAVVEVFGGGRSPG